MQSSGGLETGGLSMENVQQPAEGQLESDGSRFYTFGQLPPGTVVTGKPSSQNVALHLLQTQSSRNVSVDAAAVTLNQAEVIVKQWRESKLIFFAWLLLTAFFCGFYGVYLNRLYLLLATGAPLAVITSALYYSPWFKNSDGLFVILALMVATFMTDFLCAFLSIVFGIEEATVLGCGALIFVHGTITLYLFRRYKPVLPALEALEKAGQVDSVVVVPL